MLKTLMMTTALGGLLIGSAMAEGTPPSASNPAPLSNPSAPPAKTDAAPAMKSDMPAAKSTEMTAPAGTQKFVNSQRQDQFLASKFKGTDVIGTDDKKIGDVSDILFDKDGKIEAYVIGVGGFLGVGAKDVALAPTAFQIVPGDKSKNESDKLKLSMTQEELKNASTFEPYKAPSTTTGMGGTNRPVGGGSSPSSLPR